MGHMAGHPLVFIRDCDDVSESTLASDLADVGNSICAGSGTPTTQIAAALMTLRLQSPPVLLLGSVTTEHAATLGTALRAARTPARHYLLLNPLTLPQTRIGDYDWPDAPVTVLLSAQSAVAAAAELRGWSTVTASADRLVEYIRSVTQ